MTTEPRPTREDVLDLLARLRLYRSQLAYWAGIPESTLSHKLNAHPGYQYSQEDARRIAAGLRRAALTILAATGATGAPGADPSQTPEGQVCDATSV